MVRVALSEEFWARVRLTQVLTKLVTDFESWVQGCSCHKSQCLATGDFECQWKGCRARQFATRVNEFMDQLVGLRVYGHGLAVGASATRMMAVADAKFGWVHECPYIVWYIDSPSNAKLFLYTSDSERKSMGKLHRVTDFLTGHGEDSLRDDMARYSRGSHCQTGLGWSSKRISFA